MHIGGRASYKGITFTSEKAFVRAGDNGDYVRTIPKARSGFIMKLGNIPFLRGLTLFLQPGMIAVLALLLVNDVLSFSGIDIESEVSDYALLIVLFAAAIVLWIIQRARGRSLKTLKKYHAAEHMAINTYEAGKPLTAENVKTALRTHPRCGTNLAVIFLIIGVPLICIFPYCLSLLIMICISYELFLALPKLKFLKPLFKACLWIQYNITTARPDDSEIETAVRGLSTLMQRS